MIITAILFYLLGCGFFSYKSVGSLRETTHALSTFGVAIPWRVKLASFLRLVLIVVFWPIAFGWVLLREIIREITNK